MISDTMFSWSTTPPDDGLTRSPSRLADRECAVAVDVPGAPSLVPPQRSSLFTGSGRRNRNHILPLLSVSGDNRAERSRDCAGGRNSAGWNSRAGNPFEALQTRVGLGAWTSSPTLLDRLIRAGRRHRRHRISCLFHEQAAWRLGRVVHLESASAVLCSRRSILE